MESLKDIIYENQIKSIENGLNCLEAEYKEMLNYEVRINEHDENTLNLILNDAERRIEAARKGLSLASQIKDPAERRAHIAKMMGHLNRTRSLLNRVVDTFFPEKVDTRETPVKNSEEFISPQQAAATLGIHPSRIQSLVMGNKLRMYNDNGRWALKGSEVQKLADGIK